MDELRVESSENQHSDSEFEKVQYPGEEESSNDNNPSLSEALERPAAAPVNQNTVEQRHTERQAKKSMLESSATVYEPRETTNSWTTGLDPSVLDLIYWKDVRKTAIVFAISLVILTIFAIFPLLNIISYTSLLILTAAFAYRLYGNVICYIRKSKEPHPLSKYLEKDIRIPENCVHTFADQLVANVSKVVGDIRKLFLVERFLDSIKFALLLWLMTFIGSWLSGITVIMIGDIILFTIPKFYQAYQNQIDEYLMLANAKLESLQKAVQDKVQRKRKGE